ncbi:hypothetical protein AB205_0168490, partial [Aquarana catesbeiana]
VGALFLLSCNVCSLSLPPESQRSSRKWKEYMSRKPKDIKAGWLNEKKKWMLREVVCKTLYKHGIQEGHLCFATCSQRLFDISKFFLKDLKTSRGLQDEMKKAASNNVKQVIQWELDKLKK